MATSDAGPLRKYWIPALWVLSIPMYVWAGFRPDRYAIDVLQTHPTYPVEGVLHVIIITAIECLVLYAVLRTDRHGLSWKRAGIGLLLFCPWLLISVATLIHAPPYVFLHVLWILLVNVILFGLCVASLVRPGK